MDERRTRDRDMEQDLLSEMERDAEIRRATNVRNAMGPDEEAEGAMPPEPGRAADEGHAGGTRADRAGRRRSGEEF